MLSHTHLLCYLLCKALHILICLLCLIHPIVNFLCW